MKSARRVARCRKGLLILALLAVGCGARSSPTSSPGAPQPFPAATTSPAPTPSPTPRPALLLVGEAQDTLTSTLQSWAEQRGWEFREALGSDLGLEAAAAVLVGPQGEAELPALSAADVPVVTLDLEGVSAAPRISTVGQPGARRDQAGFLAGALAGLISQSGAVGLIGDPADEAYQTAFLHGLRYLCVGCSLVGLAPDAASADAFRAKGVDVVAVLPGAAAGAAAQRLAGAGFWLVLVDQPAEPFGPNEVAGRVVFEAGSMLTDALEALLSGQPGQAWPYSVELDSIQVVEVHSTALSAGRRQLLDEIVGALAAGSLDPGVDPKGP
jgi:hypothetical protein